MKKYVFSLLVAVAMLGIAQIGSAAEHESAKQENSKNTTAGPRQEMTDAAEAIKNYSVEKRDEAARKAKASLDALDVRINALEQQIDKDWDKMSKAARVQARGTMRALREQRLKVAEWYGGLQHSTANAWEDTKKGFSAAYKSLKSSWEKAEKEYKKDEKDKQK